MHTYSCMNCYVIHIAHSLRTILSRPCYWEMTGSDCNKGYYSVSSLIAHTHDAPLVRENGLVGSIVGCLVILIPVGETRHIINTIICHTHMV